jgi:predicted unusual protein kinase regulating ubiquinone biosynthesis (AarF/ABC1/UbiB family)
MPEANATTGAMNRGRYRRLLRFYFRVACHLAWWDLLLVRVWPRRARQSRPDRFRRLARRFRLLAIEMGGVMIKLGQFLSARVDVLPPEITGELAGLQDEVPPVSWPEMEAVLRAELGDWSRHFAAVEETPLAAASLGQAHRARRHTGGAEQRVVIKIRRPGIEDLVRTDLAALAVVARWFSFYTPLRRRANLPALVAEFAATLWEELDYLAEAENAVRFADNFAGNAAVCVPAVYREQTTERVLTLEDVTGIKITDMAEMRAAGVDPKEVPPLLLETYYRQIFHDGFFHADPHPGNLFILPLVTDHAVPAPVAEDPIPAAQRAAAAAGSRPFRLAFVDFGMVGRIQNETGHSLRRLLISVAQRDARGLTEAFQELGFLLPGADLDRISEAHAAILDRIWGRNLLQMARPDPREMQELGREFRDILFSLPFQVPRDFIFLGRAMGMLSGLASQLDPEINPWQYAEKYGRELISSEARKALSWQTILEWLRPLTTLPAQAEKVLAAAEQGQLRIRFSPDRDTLRRLERLEKQARRLNWGIVTAALLLSGSVLVVYGHTQLALATWLAAGALLLLTVWHTL